MLTLCTKNVHFTFNGDICRQTDGVAMGSSLGPVLAGIFMLHLERSGSSEYVTSILDNFHPNVEFIYESAANSKVAFLDVQRRSEYQNYCLQKGSKFRYLNWNLFCPQSWKQETLKSLVQRAHSVCSTEDLLKTQLNHIQKVLLEINDFPLQVIKQIFPEEEQKNKHQNTEDNGSSVINTESGNKGHLLVLPCQGEQGSRSAKSLKPSFT